MFPYWDGENWLKEIKSNFLVNYTIDGQDIKRYTLNGKLHRKDGPAVIIKNLRFRKWYDNFLNNKLVRFINNNYHKNDKIKTLLKRNNNIFAKYYYYHDVLHRDDGPAVIQNYPSDSCFLDDLYNTIRTKKYYQYGELHRDDGPAFIEYNRKGEIINEHYYQHGELHRENGPANIEYENFLNVKDKEEHYQNGKLHHIDGPAQIWYYDDNSGKIEKEKYFFNGKEFDPEKMPFELPIDSEEKRLYLELKI